LAHELYTPRLEYLGIAAVMSSFCKEFGERKRVAIDFRSDGLPSAIPPDTSLCLFRVLQEALHNAVQHSGVRQVDARLWGTSDQIQLTVSDCGIGFNLGTAREVGAAWYQPHAGATETREGQPFHRFATQTWYDDPRSRSSSLGRDSLRVVTQPANSPTEPFAPSIKTVKLRL
jgi:hypothetical protein